MKFDKDEYRVIKYILRKNNSVSISDLKSYFAHEYVPIVEVLQSLIATDKVSVIENIVSVKEPYLSKLLEFEKSEIELIYKTVFDDYEFALLQFLYNRNHAVYSRDFPVVLVQQAEKEYGYDEFQNFFKQLNKLNNYIFEKHQFYQLNENGKRYFEKLVTDMNKEPFIPINQYINSNISHGDGNNLVSGDFIQQLKEKETTISQLSTELEQSQIDLNKANIKNSDLQSELTLLQIKKARNEKFYSVIAFIAGAILTNAKDIWQLMKLWLHK